MILPVLLSETPRFLRSFLKIRNVLSYRFCLRQIIKVNKWRDMQTFVKLCPCTKRLPLHENIPRSYFWCTEEFRWTWKWGLLYFWSRNYLAIHNAVITQLRKKRRASCLLQVIHLKSETFLLLSPERFSVVCAYWQDSSHLYCKSMDWFPIFGGISSDWAVEGEKAGKMLTWHAFISFDVNFTFSYNREIWKTVLSQYRNIIILELE